MVELFPSREIALIIFGWSIHWYGVLYVVSLGFAIWLLPFMQKYRDIKMSRQAWLELVAWVAVGVLMGGRLGYVLLYDFNLLLTEPGKAFAIWNGGMASHGGFVGVGIVVWLYTRYAVPKSVQLLDESRWGLFLRVTDVLIVPIALGLALGRIGNVINQELFGTQMVQGLAVAKNLFIAFICYWYLRSHKSKSGGVLALFLVSYGVLRFLIEFVRLQDHMNVWGFTLGQLYTLPIIIIGVVLMIYVNIDRRLLIEE